MATVDRKGRVKEYWDDERAVVCCPLHGIEFDIRSGKCLANPRWRLRVYETTVEDGRVVVTV
jgi:nitrite reductase/ring-hydroxylating ferredoxin subunit